MRKDYIAVRNLEEQGFDLREKNKVLPSGRESVKHFVVKALIGRILHEREYRSAGLGLFQLHTLEKQYYQ